jgi:hypothetical protein
MKYKIAQSNEIINSNGGICLIGGLLKRQKALKSVDKMSFKTQKGQMPHSDILKSMIGLLSLGKTDYTSIELYREDIVFREAINLKKLPSEERLRQRIEDMACDKVQNAVLNSNIELLKQVEEFGTVKTRYCEYIPFDADVTPFDNSGSSKEGVSLTYKKHNGYAPMMGYLGEEGYMLNGELRPGSQHSQKGMVSFLRESIDAIKKLELEREVLVRLDSAHDDAGNIKVLLSENFRFLIKRNLRKESKEQWLAMAKRVGEIKSPRAGKDIYTGSVSHRIPGNRKDMAPCEVVFEVTERTVDADGQALLLPELEVNTWWTNIPDSPSEVVKLYRRHGTSEQFHSEYKTDLDIERLPSGKFNANALVLRLGMIAFNCLRIIGQRALRMKDILPVKLNVGRRRLRSVLQDIMYVGCKRVCHSGSTFLKFGRHCPWFRIFRQLHWEFC